MIYRLFTIALLGGVFAATAGASPQQVTVDRDGGAYAVSMTIELSAPPEKVRAVLTDFEHLHRINPAIVASEVLPSPAPEVTRVRTQLKSCVWFFCRKLDLVEDLHTEPGGDIRALIVAELSDMKAGRAHWVIDGAGAHTRLTYSSTMEPGFWVPPLVGPRAIVKSLHENLLATAENLERLSQEGVAGQAASTEN